MKAEKYKIYNISKNPGEVVVVDVAKSDGGPVFDFQPGQYAMLMIFDRDGKLMEEHPFSIASSPNQKRSLQFGIKMMGRFTGRLAELKKDDEIYILGPFGNFIFDPEKHKDAVFIAGGGITPFMSNFRYAFDNLQNKLTLLCSARTIEHPVFPGNKTA
jgi:predicted ferric reductase